MLTFPYYVLEGAFHDFRGPNIISLQALTAKDAYVKQVGAPRFELGTSCSQSKRATGLRYAPSLGL